jgi:hypothetical protein
MPHANSDGPSPGKLKTGVSVYVDRSNTLTGRTVNGTLTRWFVGPNSRKTAAESTGGLPFGIEPTDRGCTASVNSTRTVVIGSTFVSPLPGAITGLLTGGGVVAISGFSVSGPTVVVASAARFWSWPVVARTEVEMRRRISLPEGNSSYVARLLSVSATKMTVRVEISLEKPVNCDSVPGNPMPGKLPLPSSTGMNAPVAGSTLTHFCSGTVAGEPVAAPAYVTAKSSFCSVVGLKKRRPRNARAGTTDVAPVTGSSALSVIAPVRPPVDCAVADESRIESMSTSRLNSAYTKWLPPWPLGSVVSVGNCGTGRIGFVGVTFETRSSVLRIDTRFCVGIPDELRRNTV